MKAAFVSAAAVALLASPVSAQTIRPLVSEYQRKAHGRIEVLNDTDRPLTVVLQPRGFTVDDHGQLRDEPLPSSIRLKLSDMSFRLPPKQSRFVFYEATTDRWPSWFVLYANLTGYSAREFNGLNVQLELPHIVYLLPKEEWKAGDLRVVDIEQKPQAGTLSLVVENRSASFGRVAAVKVRGATYQAEASGFPLFPGGRRRLEFAWKVDETPDSVVVDARRFSFNQKIDRSDR